MGEVALVENEKLFVEISVAAYTTAKMLEKPHFAQAEEFKRALPKMSGAAREALSACTREKPSLARKKIEEINAQIEKASSSTGRFQGSMLAKARVKIGADIYAHGASLGRACELSGALKENLQTYLGNTRLADKYQTMPARERMRKATALFA